MAGELKLRAERKLGLLLGETVRPGNPQLLDGQTVGLEDVGVSRFDTGEAEAAR